MAFVALHAPGTARAQIANVQSLITKETPGLSTQVEGALDFRSWNNQQALFGGGVIVRYGVKDNVLLLVGRGDVIKRASNPWQERHLQHIRLRHHFNPSIVDAEVFVQHSTDLFRRLDNRFLAGAGPRFRVLTTPVLSIALGALPMFEFERIGDGSRVDAGLTRSRGRLSASAIFSVQVGERGSIRHSIYLQPRFDDANDTRVLNEFEANVNFTPKFAFRWSLVGLIDPRAPVGIVPVDTTAKSSLLVSF